MSWWTWPGLRGAVLEQIPGRVVDLGVGGCSFETSRLVTKGTFGFVALEGDDASMAEVARVCEVVERPGAASPFLVRLAFLPIALPMHALPGADYAYDAAEDRLADAGEKAGSNQTISARSVRVSGAKLSRTAQDAPQRHGYTAAKPRKRSMADDL